MVSNDSKQFASYLTDLVSNIEFHSNQAKKAKHFYNETLSEASVKQELDAFFQQTYFQPYRIHRIDQLNTSL